MLDIINCEGSIYLEHKRSLSSFLCCFLSCSVVSFIYNLFHCSPLAIVMIDEEKSNTRNLKIDESDKKKKNPMVHVNEQALVLL